MGISNKKLPIENANMFVFLFSTLVLVYFKIFQHLRSSFDPKRSYTFTWHIAAGSDKQMFADKTSKFIVERDTSI